MDKCPGNDIMWDVGHPTSRSTDIGGRSGVRAFSFKQTGLMISDASESYNLSAPHLFYDSSPGYDENGCVSHYGSLRIPSSGAKPDINGFKKSYSCLTSGVALARTFAQDRDHSVCKTTAGSRLDMRTCGQTFTLQCA